MERHILSLPPGTLPANCSVSACLLGTGAPPPLTAATAPQGTCVLPLFFPPWVSSWAKEGLLFPCTSNSTTGQHPHTANNLASGRLTQQVTTDSRLESIQWTWYRPLSTFMCSVPLCVYSVHSSLLKKGAATLLTVYMFLSRLSVRSPVVVGHFCIPW